jgi:hypothetical protein
MSNELMNMIKSQKEKPRRIEVIPRSFSYITETFLGSKRLS